MNNTPGITKGTQKTKVMTVGAKWFWLGVVCAALTGLWWCFLVLSFLGLNVLTNAVLEQSYETYWLLLSIGSVVMVFVASALTVPFAAWAFKKLKIQKPTASAVAFSMTLAFALNLFALIARITYLESASTYAVLGASLLVSVLLYGTLVRPLKHRLSTAWFTTVVIGVAAVPLVAYTLHYLWVTTLI